MTDNSSSEWLFPYGSDQRYHLHHSHLFASDIEATIAFYETWFDAKVVWDGGDSGARNVFMKIGIGAMHFYDQPPRDIGKKRDPSFGYAGGWSRRTLRAHEGRGTQHPESHKESRRRGWLIHAGSAG